LTPRRSKSSGTRAPHRLKVNCPCPPTTAIRNATRAALRWSNSIIKDGRSAASAAFCRSRVPRSIAGLGALKPSTVIPSASGHRQSSPRGASAAGGLSSSRGAVKASGARSNGCVSSIRRHVPTRAKALHAPAPPPRHLGVRRPLCVALKEFLQPLSASLGHDARVPPPAWGAGSGLDEGDGLGMLGEALGARMALIAVVLV
jgi:hypothetical protein